MTMSTMARHSDDNPDVAVRPPYLFLGAIGLGAAIDYVWPLPMFPDILQLAVGLPLIGAGLAIMIAAMRRFRRAGTNVPTYLPTRALVKSGPYRYSRNPIYLALALIHVGIGFSADSVWVLAMLLPVLPVIRWGVVAREERYLADKFGDEYRQYKSAVPRWF